MPGTTCSIFGCTNTSIKGGRLSFHTFPSDPDKKSCWIRASRRQNWTPNKSSLVCSDHFIKDDFRMMKEGQKKRLNPDAIPSFKKRREVLSEVMPKNECISNTKSDSLTLTADPLLEVSGNQESMKIRCLECRAAEVCCRTSTEEDRLLETIQIPSISSGSRSEKL